MDAPVKTDFYSSIPRSVIKLKNENEQINENEQRIILNASDTWVHVGWIADPKTERYDVFIKEVSKHNEVEDDSTYVKLGRSKYGSYLIKI